MPGQPSPRRTPRIAAFFVCAGVLAGCGAPAPVSGPGLCKAGAVAIAEVQGEGFRSPLEGREAIVRGVVTAVLPGEGIFLESTAPDASRATSEGLFVANRPLSGAVAPGSEVAVRGTVRERGERDDTQTVLDDVSGHGVCAAGLPLPLSEERLPLDRDGREALENMRLRFQQPFTVADVYRVAGGELSLAAGQALRQPTEVAAPGAEARAVQRDNALRTLPVRVPPPEAAGAAWGAPLPGIEGVLGHDGRRPRLVADRLGLAPPAPLTPPPAPDSGVLRVVNLNLRNYFNGDGRGAGFPTPRGAETPAQFADQRARVRATLGALTPHVLAVQELENDGFGGNSAAASLLEDLAAATGRTWVEARPAASRIGDDAIRVGLFYDPAAVTAVGPAQLFEAVAFNEKSRVPLVQRLRHADSGRELLVSVNHLKSKGSCPDGGADADRGDGQGCWSESRTRAAELLARALLDEAAASGTPAALIVGDLNAYRREAPLDALRGAGFVDLLGDGPGPHPFTYVFRGAAGALDHALATPALAAWVGAAFAWNVNSVYADGVPAPAPWARASDHDPVVLDLRPRQSDTMD